MQRKTRHFKKAFLLISIFAIVDFSIAQDSIRKENKFNIHFQTTYIYQYKPSFHSPYNGANSLSADKEEDNSLTATLFLGAKLWKGGELYLNPELAGGSGLSGALGMAGSSNGETFRVGDPAPALYWARFYLQQTFALGKETEWQDDDANALGGNKPRNFISIYLGKFSMGDLFDNNEYSNSPRTQFMNWSLMNNGAWDYAANVRGYTYSLAAEFQKNDFTGKLSFATLPVEANGEKLNLNFSDSFALSINAEIGKRILINNRPGNIRLLTYHNNANMGNYREAINSAAPPDVKDTRKLSRTKWGFGLNFDQELSEAVGIFGRIGWNDGKNETWAFTEIDRTISIGAVLKGKKWNREEDHGGLAIVFNGLSNDHSDYLAAGGLGFILGDGALNYGVETITELYYTFKPSIKIPIWFTGDYQFVLNPGYNKDRGPVNVFSVRMHTEF